jgi:hypothetical protein
MTFQKTNSILCVRQCQEDLLQNNALKLNILKVNNRLRFAHYRPIDVFDLSLYSYFCRLLSNASIVVSGLVCYGTWNLHRNCSNCNNGRSYDKINSKNQ